MATRRRRSRTRCVRRAWLHHRQAPRPAGKPAGDDDTRGGRAPRAVPPASSRLDRGDRRERPGMTSKEVQRAHRDRRLWWAALVQAASEDGLTPSSVQELLPATVSCGQASTPPAMSGAPGSSQEPQSPARPRGAGRHHRDRAYLARDRVTGSPGGGPRRDALPLRYPGNVQRTNLSAAGSTL